jgi:tetratricopeptide (TPR) repeat protein
MIDEIIDYQTENRYQLRRLLQSIEASYGELNLLICICDNPYYRDEIIGEYEAELTAKGVKCDRVQIDRDRPSLKQSLLDRYPHENSDRPEIVTVLGIDGLLNISREQDVESATTVNRSAQAQFFFSTQWTREALREFRFPVILWITEAIAGELSRQAPDFWSWRGGVFEFVRLLVAANGDFDLRGLTIDLDDSDTSKSSANPEAIKAQIDRILATDPDSPLLRSLYLSLGIAYFDPSRQNILTKNADLEKAISIYQKVLKISSRETYPKDWATTQHRLGLAYRHRIRGTRLDNLEKAISCYYLALEVRTRETFPEDWAKTQNNLAAAYTHRILGDRAANLEEAIRCHHLALEVYTHEAFPEDWATMQVNLATTYIHRIRGDKKANLEEAIRCCDLALKVRTRETFPKDWAKTQINLGVVYGHRILGDRAANLEESIRCCHLALEVLTREDFPEDWATTQINLSFSYINRILGDRTANLEESIRCCHLALEVFAQEASPKDWATTQMNLGSAYCYRILGDRVTNLKQAIECYQLALSIFTHEAYPEQWIQIQMNLVQAQQELLKNSGNQLSPT